MDPDSIAYYCFHAKSQNETKLTREYINIYYNKNQPQSAAKTNLKLTSRKFFGTSQSTRERTYSDNASLMMPGLEPMTGRTMKNSESSDKLQNILEEQKLTVPIKTDKMGEISGRKEKNPEEQEVQIDDKNRESDEIKIKKVKIKAMLEKSNDNGFIEVPKSKKYFPKNKKIRKAKNSKIKKRS